MAKRICDRWPGYSTEDCDCRWCVYYGGKRHGVIRCLADECVCKEELKIAAAKARRRQKNGSKNKQRNP